MLMSTMMITQAVLAAPAGLKAKKSLGDRNYIILLGYAAMIGADLAFAFFTTPVGEPAGILQSPHLLWTAGWSVRLRQVWRCACAEGLS